MSLNLVSPPSSRWVPNRKDAGLEQPIKLSAVLGRADEPDMEAALHDLAHAGRVEYLLLAGEDTRRRRIRLATDKGTDCAVALPRDVQLENGSVLLLAADRAIVVRLKDLPWLALEPRDAAAAIELGFLAGHHHWRVRFAGARLLVALDADEASYLDRIAHLLGPGKVRVVEKA